MATSKGDVFTAFLNSGSHAHDYTSKMCVLILFQSSGGFDCTKVFPRNDAGDKMQAIEEMIKYLSKKIDCGFVLSQTVQMFMNYSPYPSQCDRIVDFFNGSKKLWGVDIQFDIRIPAFNEEIRRQSCEHGHHGHALPSYADHHSNVEGLQNLIDHNIKLRPMGSKCWATLGEALGVIFTYELSDRQLEDVAFAGDFDYIFGNMSGEYVLFKINFYCLHMRTT